MVKPNIFTLNNIRADWDEITKLIQSANSPRDIEQIYISFMPELLCAVIFTYLYIGKGEEIASIINYVNDHDFYFYDNNLYNNAILNRLRSKTIDAYLKNLKTDIIPAYMFANWEVDIPLLTIPDNIQYILKGAFTSSPIKEVIINGNVSNVGEEAFYGCRDLKKVTFEEGVGSISDYAFQSCDSLQEIVLPKSLMSIGYYAFNSALKTIYYNATYDEFMNDLRNHSDDYAFDDDCDIRLVTTDGVHSFNGWNHLDDEEEEEDEEN